MFWAFSYRVLHYRHGGNIVTVFLDSLCMWCVEQTCWRTGSWRWYPSLNVWVQSLYCARQSIRFCVVTCVFLCQSIKNKHIKLCISPAPGRSPKLTGVIKFTHVHLRRVVSSTVPPWPSHWKYFWDSLCGVWNKRASVWTFWIPSPHCAWQFICSFVGYMCFPVS